MTEKSQTPKVGYVLKRYPRFSETFIVNEILAHEAAGQSVEIFALRPVDETHFQDRISQVRAPVTRIEDKQKNAESFWRLLRDAAQDLPGAWATLDEMSDAEGRDVAQAILLAQKCKRRGVTHLHAHFGTVATTVARLAAKLAGIGYSFTAHAKDIYCEYAENADLEVKLRDASAVVTVSDFNLKHLRDRFGVNASRVVRLYNGLDLAQFEFRPARENAVDILAVGRLVEKKGFNILIEAVRHLRAEGRAVRCRIVGDGEDRTHLQAQIESSGLENVVELLGPRPQRDVIAMMRDAAVLACPCVTGRDGNRDGLPTVLLEAMALGTPVISTDVTGIPELVRNNDTGLCVAEGDPQALASGLAKLLDDPDLRLRLSQSARDAIERDFDISANAKALQSIFAGQADAIRRRTSEVA